MATQIQTWEEWEISLNNSPPVLQVTVAERVATTDTHWARANAYESFLMDAYDASLVKNGCVD